MRENSTDQDYKKARKRLCGESQRFMVNSSVEIESCLDSRFVLLRLISYSLVIIVVPLPLILRYISIYRNTSIAPAIDALQ